ncbi:MAG TPA: acylphosphatase [Nitrososphaerales archaeon]|nr:acylphosphatase [Nitrososphaerales archaeon]
MIANRVVVSGRVHGVGYRASVYEIAIRSGITGHVRNMEDGRVEILAQATDEETLEKFIDSIERVRPPAQVFNVHRDPIEYSEAITVFRIVR